MVKKNNILEKGWGMPVSILEAEYGEIYSKWLHENTRSFNVTKFTYY